jgi:hypothetical protein
MERKVASVFLNHQPSSAPMKRIALLGVLLVLLVSGCVEQKTESNYPYPEPLYELYKPLVVQIQTKFVKGKPEHGFGFIVGEDAAEKQFYIVTANHVVRNEDPEDSAAQISVRLSWDSGAPRMAALLDNYSGKKELDLALLRIAKKTSDQPFLQGQSWCRDWQPRTPVWFIGWRGGMELSPEPGMLIKRIPAPARIKIWMETIQPGNSGTPLIIEGGGIVGMAVADESNVDKVSAVDIEDIYNFVHEQSSYLWKINKGNCAGSRTGHVKIVYNESTFETVQKIKSALEKDGFKAELQEYADWAPVVRSNIPNKYDRPSIEGCSLFYFSTGEMESLANRIENIVSQLPNVCKLNKKPRLEERVTRGLTIGTDEFLIVLNESPSWLNQLFK